MTEEYSPAAKVSELYLADSEAKQKRLWERVHKAMVNLKIPPAIIEHIMGKRDVEILAKNLQDWLRNSSQR
jgi:intergrase/recombinase